MQYEPEVDRNIYSALAGLLEYPRPDAAARAEEVLKVIPQEFREAREAFKQFIQALQNETAEKLEEVYTGTFYVAPSCVPYVSVHLFGEESFKRAELMAGLVHVYKQQGYEYGSELPDHIAVILKFAPRFSGEDWNDLVSFCLLKAAEQMAASFGESSGNVYRFVFLALLALLKKERLNEVDHA